MFAHFRRYSSLYQWFLEQMEKIRTEIFPHLPITLLNPHSTYMPPFNSYHLHMLQKSLFYIRSSFKPVCAKMCIPSNKYQGDWYSRLRWEKVLFFRIFSARNCNASSGDVIKLYAYLATRQSAGPKICEKNIFPTQPIHLVFLLPFTIVNHNHNQKLQQCKNRSIFNKTKGLFIPDRSTVIFIVHTAIRWNISMNFNLFLFLNRVARIPFLLKLQVISSTLEFCNFIQMSLQSTRNTECIRSDERTVSCCIWNDEGACVLFF